MSGKEAPRYSKDLRKVIEVDEEGAARIADAAAVKLAELIARAPGDIEPEDILNPPAKIIKS